MIGTCLAYVGVVVRDVDAVAATLERDFLLPRSQCVIGMTGRHAPVFPVGRTAVALFELGDPFVGGAEKTGVSKGTVVNVINQLREGRFPALESISEHVDALREIAVEIKRGGLSVSQAALGVSAFKGIESLGVPPRDVAGVLELFRRLTPEGVDTKKFVAAAMTFKSIQDRMGQGPEELEGWMNELEVQVSSLLQRCEELEPIAEQVASLLLERDRLADEVASLASDSQEAKQRMNVHIRSRNERLKTLESRIVETQRLIDQMGRRYLDQEERARQAEGRLNEVTVAVEKLAGLGLVLRDLPELATRLALAARRHRIGPKQFQDWLFSCLDNASSLPGPRIHDQGQTGSPTA